MITKEDVYSYLMGLPFHGSYKDAAHSREMMRHAVTKSRNRERNLPNDLSWFLPEGLNRVNSVIKPDKTLADASYNPDSRTIRFFPNTLYPNMEMNKKSSVTPTYIHERAHAGFDKSKRQKELLDYYTHYLNSTNLKNKFLSKASRKETGGTDPDFFQTYYGMHPLSGQVEEILVRDLEEMLFSGNKIADDEDLLKRQAMLSLHGLREGFDDPTAAMGQDMEDPEEFLKILILLNAAGRF